MATTDDLAIMASFNKKQAVLIVLFQGLAITASWRNFELTLHDCSCTFDEKLLAGFCGINAATSNHPATLDLNVTGLNQALSSIYMSVKVYLINGRADNREHIFVENRFDFCQFFIHPKKWPLMDVTYKHMTKYGEMPRQCPIEKDAAVRLRGFPFDENMMPPYMPDSGFVISVDVGSHDRPLSFMQLRISGNIVGLEGARKNDWLIDPKRYGL